MTSRQRSLKVNIIGDISDLKRDLSAIERRTQSTSQKFSQVGTALKGAFTVAALAQVGRGVGQLNELGIAADNIRNRFDVVFGDSADSVAEWADRVNERFGVSVETVQDLANSVGDLLVPLGFTRDEAAGLTQETLTLANALSEWSGGNIDVADSTERIRKALLGERESLEALGVKVLQSDVNARLAAEGNNKLTGSAKARAEAEATLAIITDKSADALKAYGDEANDALITQKELTAAIEDGQQALADIVTNEYDALQDNLAAAGLRLQNFNEWLQEQSDSADDAAASNRGMLESLIALNPIGRRALEWSEERNQALFDEAAAANRAAEATDNARRAAGGFNPALAETASQAGDAAGNLDGLVQSVKDLQAAERAATDPVFALRQANEKLNVAFAERVRLQAEGATGGAINDAIQDELEAAQDLEFARQNLNEVGTDGLDILDRYAEKVAINTDTLRAYKEEVLGLVSALNGLPSSINLPTITGGGNDIRSLEEELNRRGGAVVE